MKEIVKTESSQSTTPMLFPFEPDQFWQRVRLIVREEVMQLEKSLPAISTPTYQTPGMSYKPLYKIAEVCSMFQVTKPTVYDWIKHGKLKPYKIRSRVYFLWQDIQALLKPGQLDTQMPNNLH
ncbi:helix-turn-helix domain-containing protein [Paraflavitalea sp. CAU 1676]|uniref:helix-turn-helix domain-containing protein n=1 Tax=Paraflavitalea sp. CAU 1676 TaxID=3032598 RepID=UPI0023D9FEF6|nr:helix-turn-helix domain-containing protein [Paraflavitalea sp. CAU 1676]MDF2189832.1 helix-turn-helix domain-containing protein [Paraflavitalea sp. CAU 1676]